MGGIEGNRMVIRRSLSGEFDELHEAGIHVSNAPEGDRALSHETTAKGAPSSIARVFHILTSCCDKEHRSDREGGKEVGKREGATTPCSPPSSQNPVVAAAMP